MCELTTVSPNLENAYQDRVSNLTNKLSAMHEGENNERSSMYDTLQGKMRKLDEKLSTAQDAGTKKFTVLKANLMQFQKVLKEETEHRDAVTEEKADEILKVDAALQAVLLSEQDDRKAAELKILKEFDEKYEFLKDEITGSGKERMGNESKLRRFLEVDIPKLYEGLKEEVESREQMEHRMLKGAMDEVEVLQDAVLAEKKAREDTEEALLRMMEDVVSKMQGEIIKERQERERTEEMLLSLLNDTCQNLQASADT